MDRPLFLTGFMATGKSTVAKIVADRAGLRSFDLDSRIEERAGAPIPRIFAERGEKEFRRLERETLLDLLGELDGTRAVVSLGGGALVDRELRVEVLSRAVGICLTASTSEILRRALAEGASERPLLAGAEPEHRVEALLAERRLAYREVHARVATDGLAPEEVATRVLSEYERAGVLVLSGEQSYAVRIESGLVARELAREVGRPSGLLLVTDHTVGALHGDKVRRELAKSGAPLTECQLSPGEEHKNLQGLEAIYEAAFSASLDRKATFVGLGGGVVTDMTGFAAATWVRGVRWGGVPTTLLAMVDASVGGKTAVDFRAAKNSVGAFWQPSFVLCDVDLLTTETERMFVGALSEVVKTALIGDPALFGLLEERADEVLRRDPATITEIVERSVRVKARVVSLDEREQGLRATLNLGHTIGHALEASGGYTALTHGEAVSLGLVAACRFGERRGHTSPGLTARVTALLARLGLPFQLERDALEASRALIGHDKKRAGSSVKFVFAREVGDVATESVPLTELLESVTDLAD